MSSKLHNETWESLHCDISDYQVYDQLARDPDFKTLVTVKGSEYQFQWKGDAFSAFSVLQVTHVQSGVSRCYKRGWEVSVIGYALEEIAEGWHVAGKYLNKRLPNDEYFPADTTSENVIYV